MTLNNSDQIDGGAGTDTLYVANNITANTTILPVSVKNVEVLQLDGSSQGAVTFTLDLANGDSALTTIKSGNNTTGGVVVQNVQGVPTTVELSNTNQNFTLTDATSKMTGTTDAVTLNLSSVTGGTVTLQPATAGSGYETITVNSNGSVANTLTSLTDGNGTSLATVNVAGAQDLTLTLGDTTVTTVNASTMTGALDLTVAAGNGQNMVITGGSGNDVINMNGTYTSGDAINGGGGVDRLVLTNAEAIAATTTQTGVTNVEVIGLSDGLNGTVAVNNFGATGLRFGANMAGNSTINHAAGTDSLDLQTFSGGGFDLTVNVAGTATTDVLNITVGSTTAGNTFSANSDITINGAETVNILSQGGANTFTGNGNGFVLTDTAATQSIVITGNQNLIFNGAVRADVVNASGMTGSAALQLNGGTGTTATAITGTANADVLIGSTAGDIINGGAGADSIQNLKTGALAQASMVTAGDVLTGGDGFDTFTLRGDGAAATSGFAPTAAYALASNISDFTVGSTATTTDILQLSSTAANYAGGTAVAAFTATIAAATAVAAGATVIQTVAQNAAAAAIVASTEMIKLTTGVAAGATLQATFNAAIGSGQVTGLTANADIFATFYDTTNSKMVIVLADADSGAGGGTTLETGDEVTLIGTIDMTAANYAAFSAANFALAAA